MSVFLLLMCFFFFKQKTAYDVRISDWSLDVCSSDLFDLLGTHQRVAVRFGLPVTLGHCRRNLVLSHWPSLRRLVGFRCRAARQRRHHRSVEASAARAWTRSEEHTSELQLLMRISYAVFFLKHKKILNITTLHTTLSHHFPEFRI